MTDSGQYQRLLANQLGKGGTVFDRNGLNRTLGLAWSDGNVPTNESLLPPRSISDHTAQTKSPKVSPRRNKKKERSVSLKKLHKYERSSTDVGSTISSNDSQTFVRTNTDKSANPVRINLDRRQLTECPIIRYEPALEVLNYQHNLIESISNIQGFKKLVFIDFYDNRIKEISGLTDLPSLKVLMLGKNVIKHISGLDDLPQLDILDLHSNSIGKINGLSQLKKLRILNLSGNQINKIEHVKGLTSLLELNLRRNRIATIVDLENVTTLQRLFLSYNELTSLDNLLDQASNSINLSELTLDGNPLCRATTYKTTILKRLHNLNQLDMRRITSAEKEIVQKSFIKQEERERKAKEQATRDEEKILRIRAAQLAWEEQKYADKPKDIAQLQSELQSEKTVLFGTEKPKESDAQEGYAEIVGRSLKFYGTDSLSALDKDWGHYAMSAVKELKFKFVDFKQIAPILSKVKARFPNIEALILSSTNLYCLTQLHALFAMKRLVKLFVTNEGNPITKFTTWIHYAAFRLSSTLGLQLINDIQIESMLNEAKHMFNTLDETVSSMNTGMKLIALSERGRLPKKGTGKFVKGMKGAEFLKLVMHYPPSSDKQKKQMDKTIYNLISESKSNAKKELDYESAVPKIFDSVLKEAVHWILEDLLEREEPEDYARARWKAFERWTKQQSKSETSDRNPSSKKKSSH